MIRPLLKSHFLAVMCFLCTFAAYAQDPVGQVLVSSGEVFAVNASGEKRALVRGHAIFEQDLLVTKQGKTQIGFKDGALFTLHPNTEFKVKQYVFKPEKKASWVELVKGGLRTATGLVAREAHDSYKINTPVAAIGVRGTTFWLELAGRILEVFRERGGDQEVIIELPNGLSLILNNQHPCARVEGETISYCKKPSVKRLVDLVGPETTPFCPVDVL